MKKRFLSTGILFMVLVALLAAIGIGYAQWQKTLTINGTVNTGHVDAAFVGAFTDDDKTVDDATRDSQDAVACASTQSPSGVLNPGCDPAATGADPKLRYDKDVGDCAAAITVDPSVGTVTLNNVYPSYHCTAWFKIHNSGTIPVNIKQVRVNGVAVTPSVTNPFDLDGDGLNDVSIHVTEITLEQQIDPSLANAAFMDLDIHVLDDAPENTSDLPFTVEVDLAPWNQP